MIFSATNFHPSVDDGEFKRQLRLPPDYEMTDEVAANAAWARSWFASHARPWLCAHPIASCEVGESEVAIAGQVLTSPELTKRFQSAESAVIVGLSVGGEPEMESAKRWEADEPDRYFFMESYATAAVEKLISEARQRLCQWASEQESVLLPHYSPGYHEWSVADQQKVHTLLTQGGQIPGELEVMESGMLRPRISQLVVFGVVTVANAPREDTDMIPCKYCAQMPCDLRREPCAFTE